MTNSTPKKKYKIIYTKGQIIGNLKFLYEDFHDLEVTGRQKLRKGVFECYCGQKIIAGINSIKSGRIKSCGCEQRRKAGERFSRHGMSNSPEYQAWEGMKSRCYYTKGIEYHRYGGRGIIVCDEWKTDFMAFYNYIGPKPSPKHSLDRIDVNGNYEPGNVRWATIDIQVRNRTDTIFYEYNGEKKIMTDIARDIGVIQPTLTKRMRRGMTMEEAIEFKYDYNRKTI